MDTNNDNDLFYESPNVKITKSVLIIASSRYYIKEINGAIVTKQQNYRRYPILGAILMVGPAIYAGSIGLWLTFIGFIVAAVLMKPTYALRLKTGLGEIRPLRSQNREELEVVKDAIHKAITSDYL